MSSINITDDEILKFQKGTPIFLDDICAVYCRSIGDIVDIGYSKFQQYLNIIMAEKPPLKKDGDAELNKLLEELTDFQYLLVMVHMEPDMNNLLKEALLFFTKENVSFSLSPAQIIVGPLEEKHLLTEEKFYDFVRIIKRMYFIEQDGEEIIINKDDNPAVRALKLKQRENRAKLRRAKAKKAAQEKSDLKFSDLLGSITVNNCGLNMANIYDITYYAFQDQLKRMGWRDQYDINSRAAMAGAKIDKKQLKHWMRSITFDDNVN